MSKSVCVIGAGIGGLTAAVYLAMEGYEVTVLEKATTVGGSAGWYVRNHRMFPTGATIAFGLEEDGIFREILNDLQIELMAENLEHPMDVVLKDRTVSIYGNKVSWERELVKVFHERSSDVLAFWKKVSEISEAVIGVTRSKVALPVQKLYELGSFPSFAFMNPMKVGQLARHALWTVEDLLKKYQLDSYNPLREFLDAQLMDAVQTDTSNAALLPSAVALSIYRNGSYGIENGIGQISKFLAEQLENLGGRIYLTSPVREINYDPTLKKWQVDSKKCQASFDKVINNSGVSFGTGTSYNDADEFSWGAFRIDAILSFDQGSNPLGDLQLPFAFQIVPKMEFPDIHGPIYVTFNPTHDKRGLLVMGEITMTVSVHTYVEAWHNIPDAEYLDKKKRTMEFIQTEIEGVVPIKKSIAYIEAGTPSTYQTFVGKTGVGGFPLTVRNAILKPKSVRSNLPHLYIVGEHVFPGPGTLSSSLSGFYTARAIIKDK